MLLPLLHTVVGGWGCESSFGGRVVSHLPRNGGVQRDGHVLADHFVELPSRPIGPKLHKGSILRRVINQQVHKVPGIGTEGSVAIEHEGHEVDVVELFIVDDAIGVTALRGRVDVGGASRRAGCRGHI